MDSLNKLVESFFKSCTKLPSGLGKFLTLLFVITLTSCQPASQTPPPTPPQPDKPPSPTPSDTNSNTSNTSDSLIDDFEDNNEKNQLGGYWYTFTDQESGGTSQVSPSGKFKLTAGGANNSSWTSSIAGSVTTKYKYGFIGMGTNLDKDGKTVVDVSKYQGIKFCAKGDGKEYRVKLRSVAIKDYNDYGYKFIAPPEWKCYEIPFKDMQSDWQTKNPVPLDTALTQVTTIQWHTIGQPHTSVKLAVDDVKFFN